MKYFPSLSYVWVKVAWAIFVVIFEVKCGYLIFNYKRQDVALKQLSMDSWLFEGNCCMVVGHFTAETYEFYEQPFLKFANAFQAVLLSVYDGDVTKLEVNLLLAYF